MPVFQKGTSDKLTNGAPLPGLADDPYVHKHGVKSNRWGVRQELSEAHSTYGAARWQRENVTSTTGAISRLLRGKHGTLDVIAKYLSAARRTGNLVSTPAVRHNESKIQVFRQTPHEQAPGIESIHASQSQANRAALGTFKSDARTKTAVGAEKRRYSETRHRRVGRGEEVDYNGSAAPVCATERDRDVEVGAGQVRQEDPAHCETISPQAVKRKVGSRVRSGWTNHPLHTWTWRFTLANFEMKRVKNNRNGGMELLCLSHKPHDRHPKGEARRFSGDGSRVPSGRCQVKQPWGASVCDKNNLTKRELRHGGSRWGNLDIETNKLCRDIIL
ncbi:hypothetical protein EDB92DRAFT_1815959 [Lactarius akahatsu]|uniref:Uncharacterized protein n=1 Tax=Lactarius akahatsu TaxID=416441 RepID=A0AAD4LHJ5_9AGAM|nr:hypothetical protein EDB92DRAFT_1815959 [Lactarius akahatsu]